MRGARGTAAAGRKAAARGLVAVAVDKDKNSNHAVKWAVDNLVSKGQTILLIHVLHRPPNHPGGGTHSHLPEAEERFSSSKHPDKQIKDMFLAFRCLCTRKDIHCMDVIINEADIVRSITEYASFAVIENLVLGAPSRGGFIRKFKMTDVPSSVSRAAPDFCTVYAISKGKVASVRNASRPAPRPSPLQAQIEERANQDAHIKADMAAAKRADHPPTTHARPSSVEDDRRSISYGGRLSDSKSLEELSEPDADPAYADISFVSSGGRPSIDLMSPLYYDYLDPSPNPRRSTGADSGFGSTCYGPPAASNHRDLSFAGDRISSSSSNGLDDMDEVRRLRMELNQTMGMYNTACQEAILAKQKAKELLERRVREEEEGGAGAGEKEKEKAAERVSAEEAKAAKLVAELERELAECRALKDGGGMEKLAEVLNQTKNNNSNSSNSLRYRLYSIRDIAEATRGFDETLKIGEGGYGPVFKCELDHTEVAVKVLRPGAEQGQAQFRQEVEVLSCIRHPNMVLLLGACPEYGCLVYEYMANGSLEDRLFRRGATPPLPWQARLRIAAEIGTGLLFLHQTRPEPLVHRDLKPANILLDHNLVSKIGDVGLARLVPAALSDDITQCRMTSAAGTFCYIDPEYQQTGMLGVKSDVYSLGVLFLQILTARPPMGLTHFVQRSLDDTASFRRLVLDPDVPDWPLPHALSFAALALRCAELRRKDRPDLATVVLPQLQRLRSFAHSSVLPNHGQVSVFQDVISEMAEM